MTALLMGMLSPAAGRSWLPATARGRREAPDDANPHHCVTSFSDDPDLLAVVDAMAAMGDRQLEPATPVRGLCLVGMGMQGSGTAGDLTPVGVRRLPKVLDCPFPAQGITAAASAGRPGCHTGT